MNLESITADWAGTAVAIIAALVSLVFSGLSYRQSKKALDRADIAIQMEKDIAALENYRASILRISDYISDFQERYMKKAIECISEVDRLYPIEDLIAGIEYNHLDTYKNLEIKNNKICEIYQDIYTDFIRLKILNNKFLGDTSSIMHSIWNSEVFTENDIERFLKSPDILNYMTSNMNENNRFILERLESILKKSKQVYLKFEKILSISYSATTSTIVR